MRPPSNFSGAGTPHAWQLRDQPRCIGMEHIVHCRQEWGIRLSRTAVEASRRTASRPTRSGSLPHGVPRPFHRFKQRHQPTRQNGMRPPAPPLRTGINNPRKPMMTSLWSEQRWATDSLVQLDGSRDDEPPSMLSRTPAPSPVGDSWSATRCRPRKT